MNERIDVKKKLVYQKIKSASQKTVAIIFLSIMAMMIIVPFYWMLNTSFKNESEVLREPPTLYPHAWTWKNYSYAFNGTRLTNIRLLKQKLKEYEGPNGVVANAKKDRDKIALTDLEKTKLKNLLVGDPKELYTTDYYDQALKPYILNNTQYAYQAYKDKLAEKEILDAKLSEAKTNSEKAKIQVQLKEIIKYINQYSAQYNSDLVKFASWKDEQIFKEDYLKLRNKDLAYKVADRKYQNLASELRGLPGKIEGEENAPSDRFTRYLINTLIVGISSTIVGTFMSIIGAFALSRLEFKGRDTVFKVMLSTMMIPGEMMVITNYGTVSRLGWTDQAPAFSGAPFLAMTVPFLVTVFHIYLIRQNFRQIPNELYYAAKVDGTSDFKYLWKVMVPLANSSIITITILKLMGSWNAYIWPNLVAGQNFKLITVWLRSAFVDQESNRIAVERQMAATVIVLIPLLLVFIFLRKYIMRGVARGGTKG